MGTIDSRWQCAVLAGLAVFLALPVAADPVKTLPNPHDSAQPEYCLNCHTESVYQRNCDDPSGFCLLADSVDALCLLCHVKEDCCRRGQEHQAKLFLGQHSHASDVETSRVKAAYRPSSLPTHNGRITCRTCHLHTRRPTGDYKMLRIVKRTDEYVDWSVLCADCHEENY